jgi:hypothetical protein
MLFPFIACGGGQNSEIPWVGVDIRGSCCEVGQPRLKRSNLYAGRFPLVSPFTSPDWALPFFNAHVMVSKRRFGILDELR